MTPAALKKLVDEANQVRGRSGRYGILREEVWIDKADVVVKYNLAFVHFDLCQVDHGRVYGCDNAHGFHETHWMGEASRVTFVSYDLTLARFIEEVATLKEQA